MTHEDEFRQNKTGNHKTGKPQTMTVDLMIKVNMSLLLSFRGADRSILQNSLLWATAAKAQHDASMSSHMIIPVYTNKFTCILLLDLKKQFSDLSFKNLNLASWSLRNKMKTLP